MIALMPEHLAWTDVAAKLSPARNFWLGTVDADGGPHSVPVWAVVVADVVYFFGERRSKKFRNIAGNPKIVLHLESGDEVVIVRGTVVEIGEPAGCATVVDAFASKYTEPGDEQWLPAVDPTVDIVARLEPSSALLWSGDDFDASQRRWSAGP
jgi:nitroimidazol reductase NimA-like FMN-containing flavoprotein (pyridoxamine 5'-phosphate oxidase superfamily)